MFRFDFRSFFAKKFRRAVRKPYTGTIRRTILGEGTGLEERLAPAIYLLGQPVAAQVVSPGQTGVELAKATIYSTAPGAVDGIDMSTIQSTSKLSYVSLRADLNHTPGDGPNGSPYETLLAGNNVPQNGKVHFNAGFGVSPNQPMQVQVVTDVPFSFADGTKVGMNFSGVSGLTPNGKSLPSSQEITMPAGNTIHTVQNRADGAVTILSNPSVARGDVVIYNVNVTDFGPQSMKNSTVTMKVPNGLTFNASKSSFGTTLQGGNVVKNLGTLVAVQTETVSIAFNVPVNYGPGAIVATAKLTSTTADPNQSNNQFSAFTMVTQPSADLSITFKGMELNGTNTTVGTGDYVQYRFAITNSGPAAAKNVTAVASLPDGWDFDSSKSYPGVTNVFTGYSNTAVVTIPSLQSGETRVYYAVYHTGVDAGPVTTSASVFSTTLDSNPANNISLPTTINLVYGQLSISGVNIGANETVVHSQKNVLVSRFEARADYADVLLTSVSFVSATGVPIDLLQGQNWTFWGDTTKDGKVDTVIQSGVTTQNNRVTFNNMTTGGFVIPRGQTVVFEVHTDITSSTASNKLAVQFDLANPYVVEAENPVNGGSLQQANIFINPAPAKLLTIVPHGDLYVSLDPTPVRNLQLLGGKQTDPVYRLTFTARNEGIRVQWIQLSFIGNIQSVQSAKFYFDGATTPFGTATPGGNGTQMVPTMWNGVPVTSMTANTTFTFLIPKDESKSVYVALEIKSDTDGGKSGEFVQPILIASPVINNALGLGTIRAFGNDSSENLGPNDNDLNGNEGEIIYRSQPGANQDLVGKQHVVVMSHVTINNAHPAPNGSAVPTGVANIGMFKFNGDVNSNTFNGLNYTDIDGLIVTINAPNVSLATNSLQIYNIANSSVAVSGKVYDTAGIQITAPTFTGSVHVVFEDFGTSPINVSVASGQSITLAVRANVLNAKINPALASSLQTSLGNFNNPFAAPFGIFGSHIRLVDRDFASFYVLNWNDSPFSVINGPIFMD